MRAEVNQLRESKRTILLEVDRLKQRLEAKDKQLLAGEETRAKLEVTLEETRKRHVLEVTRLRRRVESLERELVRTHFAGRTAGWDGKVTFSRTGCRM